MLLFLNTQTLQGEHSMIKLIFISTVLAFGITACSSGKKKEEAAKAAEQAVTKEAEAKKAEAKKSQEPPALECVKNKDIRTVQVVKVEPNGCEVQYSKFGNKTTIASSAYGTEHCEKVKEQIKSNLESASFKCT